MGAALDRVLAALNERGLTVIKRSGYYSAQCPAHDDRMPSLSVRGVAGKVLLKCFPGCRTVDVAAALDLPMPALFDEEADLGRLAAPVVVAEYEYVDEHGELLYVVERRFPKGFRQKRPDGHGKWIYNLQGVRRVPYRLPALIEAVSQGRMIYIVEGEKDVHTLERHGLVATCGPGGNGMGWKPEYGYSHYFKGAAVTIVSDKDDAGRALAKAIFADLAGVAEFVEVVEAADGKDATDHFSAGFGLNEFVRTGAFLSVQSQEPAPEAVKPPALSGEEWDVPLPCDWPTELPGWPAGVFPATVEAWVRAAAEETQTPVDLAGAAALGIISGAIGGKVKVQCPTWSEPTNLWAVPVLAPGSRKSAVIQRARRPLDAAEAQLLDDIRDEVLNKRTEREIREKHAEQAKLAASKEPTPESIAAAQEAVRAAADVEVPIWPRLVTSDATPEKLGSLLALCGGRITAISAEAGIFSSLTGRYAKVPNLDPMLQAHAGDTIIVDRQSRDPERVEDPALSVLASVQPFAMQEMISRPDFAGRGLLARILWCLPVDMVGRRKVRGVVMMPAEVAAGYHVLVTDLATTLAKRDAVTLALSVDAAEALLCYAERVEKWLLPEGELGSSRLTREWGSKLVGATARIAGCLHLARGLEALNEPISASTMRAAIRLGEYFRAHAVAAMAPTDVAKASTIRYVLDKLIEHDLSDFKVRDLHRKVQKKLPSAGAVREVLDELVTLGWIREGGKEYQLYPDAQSLLNPGDKGDKGDKGGVDAGQSTNGGTPPPVTLPGDTGDTVTLVTGMGDTSHGGVKPGLTSANSDPVTLVTPVTRVLSLVDSDDSEGEWSA